MEKFNFYMAKIWIWLLCCFSGTTVKTRAKVGTFLGWVLWFAVPKRRHVMLTNLRLCFPELSEKERVALAKRTYARAGRAALDHAVLFKGTKEELQALVHYEGLELVTNPENRPLIVVAPHFIGLDAVGIAFNTHVRGCSLYQKQANAAWDKACLDGRLRFCHPVLIEKSNHSDLRPVIRAIREGLPFYYLPDMDHGRKNSIFVPFFGVQAATLPMVSRLARLTRAKVLWCISEMTDEGYVAHLREIPNFPTADYVADTVRINQELEAWIRKYPDQYLWTHRRFKTRPEGEPSVY